MNNEHWKFIDKIIYINLEERKDRKELIEKELSFIEENKIIRFNAFKNKKGGIGCMMSHIACLELAITNNWNNVLILEDDAKFNNYDIGIKLLHHLLNNKWDVISLGCTFVNYNKNTFKLNSGQCASGYLVNKHYYQTLLNNLKEALTKYIETDCWSKYANDQYWKILQKTDNWYVIVPSLIIQRPSFSSIENRNVDYTRLFP